MNVSEHVARHRVSPTHPIGAQIAEWAAGAGVQEAFVFPSAAVDGTLTALAGCVDGIRLIVASNERSAGVAAEALSVTTGRPAAVIADSQWMDGIGPTLLPDSRVHVISVGGDRPPGWEHRELWGTPQSARQEASDPLTGAATPTVAVLPPPHHPDREASVAAVLSSGTQAITCVGVDSFAREHPDLWVGRVGFLPTPRLLELAEQGPDAVRWAVLPGARVPPWAREQAFAATPAEVSRGWAQGSARIPRATPEARRSPLARVVGALSDSMPDALTIADSGAAHRVVAAHVANQGRAALITDGLTPMGWSLPTALGAGAGCRGRRMLVVVGDGSALNALSDLAVLVKHGAPCAVVLARNGTLGNRPRPAESAGLLDFSLPHVDWSLLAAALGLPMRVADLGDLASATRWVLGRLEAGGPCLLVVDTPPMHASDYADRIGIGHIDELQLGLALEGGRT